jgi:DNA-binding NarL/FixJ family response regulator
MSTKHVILAEGPRLIREMLRRVIDQAEHLEVVQEVADREQLASAIERFDPEWVILSSPLPGYTNGYVDACLSLYPSVRFLFLDPGDGHIKMKWQTSYEEEFSDLSLKDFLEILEKHLQRTGR